MKCKYEEYKEFYYDEILLETFFWVIKRKQGSGFANTQTTGGNKRPSLMRCPEEKSFIFAESLTLNKEYASCVHTHIHTYARV